MPTRGAERKSRLSAGQASAVLALAAASWGGVWWWQSHQAPAGADKHLEAGWLRYREGRIEQAESEWLEAVRISPKDDTAWEALGDLYLASGQWEPARKAYVVVAQLSKSKPHLWTKLASATVRMGDAAGARAAVDAALQSDPDDVEALNILSTLLMRAQESRQRTEVLQHLARLKPDDPAVLTKAADALMIARRYPEAKPLIDRILTLDPRSSVALSMRGAVIFKQETSPSGVQRALSDFRTAIALKPDNWVARWYLGRCYLRLNQPRQALEELRTVDAARPPDRSYMLDLAAAYQQSGQEKLAAVTREQFAAAERQGHAISELRSRRAASPNDFDANLQLGLRLLTSPYPAEVEDALQAALKLRPKDPQAQKAMRDLEADYARSLLQGLQNLHARKGMLALQHLSRALQLRPLDPRTRKAVEELAAALRISFYEAQLQLERLPQS